MFPVAKDKLSFADISDFWSRHIRTAHRLELLALLEQAWWRGEIRGVAATTRLQLLQSMFRSLRERSDLGIVFVKEGDEPSPQLTDLPDGSVDVDMRFIITVPADDVSGWTEQMCEHAFDARPSAPRADGGYAEALCATEHLAGPRMRHGRRSGEGIRAIPWRCRSIGRFKCCWRRTAKLPDGRKYFQSMPKGNAEFLEALIC
jgi:hypothetical protein